MANRIKLAGTTANAFTIGLNGVTLDSSNASSAYTLVLPSTDGNANQVLSTNGSGNLNWVDVQAGTPNAIVNGNSNVTVDANSNIRVSVAGTPNTVTFTSSNTVFNTGSGGNITGANLIQANFFSGNGSLLTGLNASNVVGTVANANYAAYSANVTGNAQPNITSVGTLTDLTVTGNVSANYYIGNGSLLTGVVAGASNAIVNGNSNVTVDANSNVRVSVSGNANVATFTDTGLVLGAGTGGNISNANVISANLFSGNGALLTALNGANVTGIVANANYAAFSGNVTVNAQPNITSVGTLTGLTVDGNITANVYKLNLAAAQTANAGEMTWNASDGTMDLGMLNGVTQQVGEETYFYVKANAAITNGRVVMFDGVQGGTINARHANTSAAGFKPSYVMGVATQDIALNDDGYITAFGKVNDLDTSAYPAGSLLWLEPNSDGNLTTTEPAAPGPKILVAASLSQSTPPATNGRIFVRPELGLHMYDLHDVSSNNAVAGDVLVYNSSNIWVTSNTVPTANVAYSVSGANVSGSVAQANFANTANAVSGANVSGQVGNALVAGTVYTAAQPNITSVGNLTSLDVTGTANLGQVANVKILGGSNAQVLSTDGTGNLNWVTATGGSGTPGGNTTELQFNNSGIFGGTPNVTFASGNLSLGNIANVKISGGSSNQVIQTDGSGNLSFVTPSTGGGGDQLSPLLLMGG